MDDNNAGHRDRLRQKSTDKGLEALTDLELFELLLFSMLPRRDTKPIAKTCFNKFHNFSGIINASEAELSAIAGLGPKAISHIKALKCLFGRLSFERVKHKNILSSWEDLQFYCIQELSNYPVEAFLMIMLDNQNQVIDIKELGRGTVNQMAIYPREVLKLALSYEELGVFLVHNHPSQDERASREDIHLTKNLQNTLRPANITLHDHLIVAGGKCISLRNQGLFSP